MTCSGTSAAACAISRITASTAGSPTARSNPIVVPQLRGEQLLPDHSGSTSVLLTSPRRAARPEPHATTTHGSAGVRVTLPQCASVRRRAG
jgi:hypothetical protein